MKKIGNCKHMKSTLLLGLLLASLCLAMGCGNPVDEIRDGMDSISDMASTLTPDTTPSVLDKGGANGTDNDSIMDYLEEIETTSDITEEGESASPSPAR